VLVAGTLPKTDDKSEVSGSLSVALDHARRLLDAKPLLAEQQAQEILQVVPGNADATLILGVAQRRSDRLDAARSTLEDLVATKPLWPTARYELGLTLAALGLPAEAERALVRTTELNPQMSDAWRAPATSRQWQGCRDRRQALRNADQDIGHQSGAHGSSRRAR